MSHACKQPNLETFVGLLNEKCNDLHTTVKRTIMFTVITWLNSSRLQLAIACRLNGSQVLLSYHDYANGLTRILLSFCHEDQSLLVITLARLPADSYRLRACRNGLDYSRGLRRHNLGNKEEMRVAQKCTKEGLREWMIMDCGNGHISTPRVQTMTMTQDEPKYKVTELPQNHTTPKMGGASLYSFIIYSFCQ